MTSGSLFGLTSVDLADPNSPSLSPVSISFIGYLLGGATVTNTFTTPGNGATTFLNYSFTPEFASLGFTHVDILAPRWAMDNLVVIPEPSSWVLIVVGACFLMLARSGRQVPGTGSTLRIGARSVKVAHSRVSNTCFSGGASGTQAQNCAWNRSC